jgi:hypothetical protein
MTDIITAQDMYRAFLVELNKEVTGTVFPDEFEGIINHTQIDYIQNRYFNVEGTEKRTDDLRMLTVIDETILNTGAPVAGQELFVLPYNPNANVVTPKNPSGTNNGYMFMLAVGLKLQYVNSPCKYTGVSGILKSKPMKSDKKYEILRDPFNRPTEDRLYYQITGDSFVVFTGTQSFVTEAHIDYVRYPRKIQLIGTPVDCELPLHSRQELVRMAVSRKLEEIESRRFQTNTIENNQVIQ